MSSFREILLSQCKLFHLLIPKRQINGEHQTRGLAPKLFYINHQLHDFETIHEVLSNILN